MKTFLSSLAHSPSAFLKKMLVLVFFATLFATSASAAFSPTSPAFPHGAGITRQSGTCTEANPNCPTGLSFPSFNNFRDSITSIGVSDERNFAKIKNYTANPAKGVGYGDIVSAKHGDVLLIASYVHNNAHAGRPDLNATNVSFKIDGMFSLGAGQYVSSVNTTLKLDNFISASNTNPGTVGDDVYVNSENGKPIRLRYVPGTNQMTMTKTGQLVSLDGNAAFSSGVSLGDVAGCAEASFYVYTYVYVEEFSYDLTINKTVDSVKTIAKSPGGTARYKVDFTNVSGSKTEANNVKVVDDYDETKVSVGAITPQASVPLTCADDGTKIVCQLGRVMLPNETLSFSYDASIKQTATGTIDNTARVCAPYTDVTDPALWTIPNCIPFDTVKTNNTSSAQITLNVQAPTCGPNSKTFGPNETAYPSTAASYFCTTGTPIPATPAFPNFGETISWTCSNGGQTANCSATRTGGIVDVTIDKSVNATQKQPGETVQYTLSFRNASDVHGALPNGGANVAATGVQITDLFDSRYINVSNIQAPAGVSCSVSYETDPISIQLGYGGKMQCSVSGTMNPTSVNSTITYTGTLKNTASFTSFPTNVPNFVAITATNETNNRQNDNQDNVVVIVNANPTAGQCGTNGTANTPKEYAFSDTAYPATGTFCANGATPVPSPPAFPAVGQTISWTCPGNNGGNPATCSAKRGNSPIVDVTIDKTVNATEKKPGDILQYTLAFRNASDIHNNSQNGGATAAATGIEIIDIFDARYLTVLPQNIQAPAGFTCSVSLTDPILVAIGRGVIKCTSSSVLAPSSNNYSVSYTATVKSANAFTLYPTNVENSAHIIATNETINRQNDNQDDAIVIVRDSGSPSCTISANPTSISVGGSSTLTWITTNAISAILNSESVLVNSSKIVSPMISTVYALTVTAQNGQQFVCQTSVSVAVPNILDLSIQKSVSPTTAKAGDIVTYTLQYQNLSDITATNVVIKDFYDTTNLENISGLPVGCTIGLTAKPDAVDPMDTTQWKTGIVCQRGSLTKAQGVQAITYTAKIKSTTANGTQIPNTAYVMADQNETNTTNNKFSAVVVVSSNPITAFTIVKEVSTDGTTYTENITRANAQNAYYRVKVRNTGSTVGNITVRDALSAATNGGSLGTILSETYTVPAGATLSGTLAANTLAVSNFPINGELIILYQRTASTTGIPVNGTTEIVDTATLAGPSVPTPQTDTAKVTMGTSTLPTCSLTANPTVITSSGQAVTLNWTTVNAVSANLTPTPGAITNLPNGSTVVYPANNTTYTLTVTSASGATATCNAAVTLSISSSSSSSGSSSGGGGCSSQGEIDLSISKFMANGTAWIASDKTLDISKNKTTTVRYKVVLSNSGSLSPNEVTVSDVFSSENGFSVSNIRDISGATYNPTTKTFTTPAVAVGRPLEFFYTADVKAGSSGTGKNTVKIETISYNSVCPILKDKKGVGRTSIATVSAGNSITPPPDGIVENPNYTLDKKVDRKFVKAGEIVNYTILIKNTGNVDMENVVLIDKFPSEFLSPSEEIASRLTSNNTLEFKRKFLPAGDTFSVTVKMKVRDGVPAGTEITNILTAKSDTIQINESDKTTIVVQDEKTPVTPNVPKVTQTGMGLPLVSLGLMLLGGVIFFRRKDFMPL